MPAVDSRLDPKISQGLRRSVRGQVILPGEAGYDERRKLFYAGMDKHPAAIVRVASAADVAHVLAAARESGKTSCPENGSLVWRPDDNSST